MMVGQADLLVLSVWVFPETQYSEWRHVVLEALN